MIRGEIKLADDTSVFTAYFAHPPRVGEYLWPTGEAREAIAERFGTGSFIVVQVAHWCMAGHVPAAGGEPIHTIAIYVEPFLR